MSKAAPIIQRLAALYESRTHQHDGCAHHQFDFSSHKGGNANEKNVFARYSPKLIHSRSSYLFDVELQIQSQSTHVRRWRALAPSVHISAVIFTRSIKKRRRQGEIEEHKMWGGSYSTQGSREQLLLVVAHCVDTR